MSRTARIALSALLGLAVSVAGGCALFRSFFPPTEGLHAELSQRFMEGGLVAVGPPDACADIAPALDYAGVDNEVLTVSFRPISTVPAQLEPQMGDRRTDDEVPWSWEEPDGTTYVTLARPPVLSRKKVMALVGRPVCVTFHEVVFEADELDGDTLGALSGQTCCGTMAPIHMD